MGKTATIAQATEVKMSPSDADNLLYALGKMQAAFMKAFRVGEDKKEYKPEYLTPLHWNMCVGFWCARNSEQPMEKEAVLDWRYEPDPNDPKKRNKSQAIVGDNKAREHLKLLDDDDYIEEYIDSKISPRKKFIRGTKKLYDIMEGVFSVGVVEIKKSFK